MHFWRLRVKTQDRVQNEINEKYPHIAVQLNKPIHNNDEYKPNKPHLQCSADPDEGKTATKGLFIN